MVRGQYRGSNSVGGGGGLKLSWLSSIKNNTTAPLMIIIYESIIFVFMYETSFYYISLIKPNKFTHKYFCWEKIHYGVGNCQADPIIYDHLYAHQAV